MPINYTPHFLTEDLQAAAGFDVVGDVHGCFDELLEVLSLAKYNVEPDSSGRGYNISHPQGRKLFFVGDLTDRGPKNIEVLRFAKSLIASDMGSVTIGNHDYKLLRALCGQNIVLNQALEGTLNDLEDISQEEVDSFTEMLKAIPTQVLVRRPGDVEVIIVHGAAHEKHQLLLGGEKSFRRSIYGYPDGNVDDNGNICRKDWAADYAGLRKVIHGHEPVRDVIEKNGVYDIDTGCVFGGSMTLFRVYEDEFIQVRAHAVYHKRGAFSDGFVER